ncbi:MAG: T9SS type A sorting domain-containing protein [Bacteroidales bacterium]|nr:T9SS type A sorting domain-containing protein [Bacteroidales bacterium]
MKKIALISLFVVLSTVLFAQNWFRDGATWTFDDQQEFTYQAHGYDKYTVVGDTVINDTAAKQILHKTVSYMGTEYGGNVPSIIVHESNSRVYYWDGTKFVQMYDLSLNVGDTLDIYSFNYDSELYDSVSPFVVDSVYIENINGVDLKVQEFSCTMYGLYGENNEIYSEKIIERIGSEKSFFYHPECPGDVFVYTGLRCYNDDEVSYRSYMWNHYECDERIDESPIFSTNWLWSTGLFSSYDNRPCGSYYMKLVDEHNANFKLMKSTDKNHTYWVDAGYMYSYNGKVYYFRNADDERVLLYDFTLEEGDEFYVDALQTNLVVDSVGSMMVGNTQRKTLYLSAMGQQVVWCEGIGSLNGLLNNYGNIGIIGGSEELLCVQNNDETLYHNPRHDECYISRYHYFEPRSRWTVVQTNIFDPRYYREYNYEVLGDTLINDVYYYKLLCDGNYYAALRESYDNKIYAYFSSDMGSYVQIGEYLIYDFDWTPNKTLYCQSLYDNSMFEQATLGSTIDSILLLDGNYYKWNGDIIQGIGSLSGFFWYSIPHATDGSDYGLHTFYRNDVLVYRNPTLDGIADDCNNRISVYPNPSSGKFNISVDGNEGRADIYDSLGRKVTSIESLVDAAEVDLSGYGKGVYLVVFDIDGKLVEKKVVVE